MQSKVARSGTLALTLLAFLVAPFFATAADAQGAPAAEVLTNTSVVKMLEAKVAKDIILTKIRTTRTNFDVTAAGLVRLQQSKVAADYMKAMMLAATDTKMAVPITGPAEVLTNTEVVAMITGQVPKAIILEKIRNTKAKYDLSTEGTITLTTNKVPQDVVKAMMAVPPGE